MAQALSLIHICDLVAALAEDAVVACHQVDGADAAGTAGSSAVLMAGLTQSVLLFLGHGQFGGEGAVAHAGGVGLHDADGVVQLVAGDAGADGCISSDDVGGGGVGAVSYTHLDVYKRQPSS